MAKPNLTISPDKVFYILVKAREFDAKEQVQRSGFRLKPGRRSWKSIFLKTAPTIRPMRS